MIRRLVRRSSVAAAVGLLAGGLLLSSAPPTYAAAPGDQHLPRKPGITKIFPKFADEHFQRYQGGDRVMVPVGDCAVSGPSRPVRWSAGVSVMDAGSGSGLRVDAAKMKTRKAAKRMVRGYARLSSCKKVDDNGTVARVRPRDLPAVGDDRVGFTARGRVPGSSEVTHASLAVVRKGRKVVIANVYRTGSEVRHKKLRKLARLVARKL